MCIFIQINKIRKKKKICSLHRLAGRWKQKQRGKIRLTSHLDWQHTSVQRLDRYEANVIMSLWIVCGSVSLLIWQIWSSLSDWETDLWGNTWNWLWRKFGSDSLETSLHGYVSLSDLVSILWRAGSLKPEYCFSLDSYSLQHLVLYSNQIFCVFSLSKVSV